MEAELYQNELSPTRRRDRVSHDRALVHAVLDEALVCHLGVVVDGRPHVLPTAHWRVGDTVYVHGSVAARVLDAARGGPLPLCLTVSLLDGLVLARSAFHHSLQYRSVVVHGEAHLVTDEREKARLLAAFVDHVVPGRAGQCRPPSRRELAASAVLALPLDEAAVKVRTGPPVDDEDDLALPHWAGVLPLRLAPGPPEPACELPVPAAVAAYGRPAAAVPVP